MPYEITIKETQEITVQETGQWTVIEKRPWTDEEISMAANRWSEIALKENPLKEVIGYAPTREVTKNAAVEVLKQTVETLDLAAVIKAINNL